MSATSAMANSTSPDHAANLAAVLAYHERTKHAYGRYARSLGFLDWDNQPDPFRRYPGAPLTLLNLPDAAGGPSYEQLFHPGSVASRPLDQDSVSELLYFSLALSAWKRHETSRWSLRVNPSSGNLHPTEAYLFLPTIAGLSEAPALHHYAPKEHGLERRATLDARGWEALREGLPSTSFLMALSSIPWRESWKYGERAWRYCQHDVGHALAALRFSAALLGWRLTALPDVPDERLAGLLGLDRAAEFVAGELEHPDLLMVIDTAPQDEGGDTSDTPEMCEPTHVPGRGALAALQRAAWSGRANLLSAEHVPWDVIDEVGRASRRDEATPSLATRRPPPTAPVPLDTADDVSLARPVIRERRSAVSMDGRTGLTSQGFFEMMARLVPTTCAVPWDGLSWPTAIHLGLFVHRVAGLAPGLYVLVREPAREAALRDAMHQDFVWQTPEGCPPELPLRLLAERDLRAQSAGVSCGQDIAADGAFSLGMLADFEATLSAHGPSAYRNLFWEAGAIGQTLYLEAQAAGIAATGIGCFFDDPVHGLFGLSGRAWQSLYHFTVGGPVDDTRLASEAAYAERGAGS